jgi:hypothetical protein
MFVQQKSGKQDIQIVSSSVQKSNKFYLKILPSITRLQIQTKNKPLVIYLHSPI